MGLNAMDGRTESMRMGRGRGIGVCNLPPGKCLCIRPHRIVICNVCGYWTMGRVRYFCPVHPQTIFLFDIPQCPQCKAYGFMMTEID